MKIARVFTSIDTHTGGEPTRTIIGGLPYIPGKTVGQKMIYLKENMVLLGIEDTDTNRKLLDPSPPSAWLVIQSCIVLVSPVALIALIILVFIVLVKRKKHSKSN